MIMIIITIIIKIQDYYNNNNHSNDNERPFYLVLRKFIRQLLKNCGFLFRLQNTLILDTLICKKKQLILSIVIITVIIPPLYRFHNIRTGYGSYHEFRRSNGENIYILLNENYSHQKTFVKKGISDRRTEGQKAVLRKASPLKKDIIYVYNLLCHLVASIRCQLVGCLERRTYL